MIRRISQLGFLSLLFAAPLWAQSPVKLQRAFSSITAKTPVALIQSPREDRFYLVQKTGLISTFTKPDGSDLTPFLDLQKTVNAVPNEAGLLGMAFNPNKADEFYLSYTIPSAASPANLRSVVARFHTANGLTADNKPEILLTLEQPYANHNGGHLAFGPDGYLYAGFGDGGSGGDPLKNGQNLNTLFGKILRLDVSNPGAYVIPKDNPFIGKANIKSEIYAYGLRNPWRFNFDTVTGDLWVGDVGQSQFEEIDVVKSGGNYGWNIKEGFSCYSPATNCPPGNSIDPVHAYGRSDGGSVTGGYVYRGKAISALIGQYIFADFVSGKIWSLTLNDKNQAKSQLLLSSGINISSFAQDNKGEIYVLNYQAGTIHKLVPAAEGSSGGGDIDED